MTKLILILTLLPPTFGFSIIPRVCPMFFTRQRHLAPLKRPSSGTAHCNCIAVFFHSGDLC